MVYFVVWSCYHGGADPVYDGEFGSIEFNIGKDDSVQSLALHVRASTEIVFGILQLCERLSCQAIDLPDGSLLDQSTEHPATGWISGGDIAIRSSESIEAKDCREPSDGVVGRRATKRRHRIGA